MSRSGGVGKRCINTSLEAADARPIAVCDVPLE